MFLLVRAPYFVKIPELLFVLAISTTFLMQCVSAAHAHDDATGHAHRTAICSVESGIDASDRFRDDLDRHCCVSFDICQAEATAGLLCCAPPPQDNCPVVEAVIAQSSGRVAPARLRLIENPFDAAILSLATSRSPVMRSLALERDLSSRDDSSPLAFILRTNHAFLA